MAGQKATSVEILEEIIDRGERKDVSGLSERGQQDLAVTSRLQFMDGRMQLGELLIVL